MANATEDRKSPKTKVKTVKDAKAVAKIKVGAGVPQTQTTVAKWWNAEPDQMYLHVSEVVKTIQNQQAARKDANARWLRLYTNFDMVGMLGGVYNRMLPVGSFANRNMRFTYNVIESCIDAVSAKISKARPAPKIETNDGTFKQQRKARLLNGYLATMFEKLKAYEQGQKAFTDACIFGTGLVKVYIEDEEIKLDRVLVNDIIVDEQDGMAPGGPRQMHQDAHVDRDVLMSLYPDKAEEIAQASTMFAGQSVSLVNLNLVAIRESWHLPSCEGADDGVHVICCSNATLVHEEWEHHWFPFAVYRWKNFIGWHGTGLAQQLTGIQIEIHKICMLIAQSIAVNCKPTVFVPMEADIVAEQISEEVGVAVRYSGGREPTFQTPGAQSAEVYAYLETIFDKAYTLAGISQLSAQSEMPAGLKSGAAIREFENIETTRFELQEQRLEQELYCDLAMKVLTFSKKLYQESGEKVLIKDRHFRGMIDWREIDMDFDEFEMSIFPVSSLPDSPAGRMETIEDYIQAGYIDKANAMDLLRLPDLDDYVSVEVAGIENAKAAVDGIKWDGDWVQPDAMMDLNSCIRLATAAWLNGQNDDTPSSHIDMLTTFIDACMQKQREMNPPPPPPPPGPPQGKPGPLPVSPMMPRGTQGAPPPPAPSPQ